MKPESDNFWYMSLLQPGELIIQAGAPGKFLTSKVVFHLVGNILFALLWAVFVWILLKWGESFKALVFGLILPFVVMSVILRIIFLPIQHSKLRYAITNKRIIIKSWRWRDKISSYEFNKMICINFNKERSVLWDINIKVEGDALTQREFMHQPITLKNLTRGFPDGSLLRPVYENDLFCLENPEQVAEILAAEAGKTLGEKDTLTKITISH